MRFSLRARIFLILMVPLVMVAGVVGALRQTQADRMLTQLQDNTLLTVAYTISRDVISSRGDLLTEDLLDKLTKALGDPVYYHVSALNGGFVTGYSDVPASPKDVEIQGGIPVFYDSLSFARPVRVVTLREFIADPQFDGWTTVTVWQSVTQRQARARRFARETSAILVSVVATAGLLLWFGIQLGLKPLLNVRDAIGQRSADDLTPIRRWVPHELEGIVASANDLFARLLAAFAARETFIADAAHQIRNPVAALQSQADAALTAQDETILRSRVAAMMLTVRHLGRLTNQLLSLERARGGLMAAHASPVPLHRLAHSMTSDWAERLLPEGVSVSFDVRGTPAPVLGDQMMLEEMLHNLIDNAVKYGLSAGGELAVTLDYAFDHLTLSVADSGVGIPAIARARVFDRFFRVSDEGPEGSGLGLAIVKDIATSHGGFARCREVPLGCTIDVVLPVSRSQPAGEQGADA